MTTLSAIKFHHLADPLTAPERAEMKRVICAVAGRSLAGRIIDKTAPLGTGVQSLPGQTLARFLKTGPTGTGWRGTGMLPARLPGLTVPLLYKDFIMHWRDLEESRLEGKKVPTAAVAAAAGGLARSEDQLLLFGEASLGYAGLMNQGGTRVLKKMRWDQPGDAFSNFTLATQVLSEGGYRGPFAAVVHPAIFAGMHRVMKGSGFLEITHTRAVLTSGVFRSTLLAPATAVVISLGAQNMEIVVSSEPDLAFLGAKFMNLPFRVFEAKRLVIKEPQAICRFEK